MAEETDTFEEEATAEAAESGGGSGLGFKLGVILGMLAGAAGATLLAPAAGEESPLGLTADGGPGGQQTETPATRVRSVLDNLRARVQEASAEAQEAAREAEEQTRARFEELTREGPPAGPQAGQ